MPKGTRSSGSESAAQQAIGGARPTRRHPGHRRLRMGCVRWSRLFCADRCTAPSRRPATPATDCAWRWRMAPTWPTWAKRGGCRSCRFRATRSTGNHAAAACAWSAPARAASSSTGPAGGSSTRPATTTRWPVPSTTWTHVTAMPTTQRGSCSIHFTSSATAFWASSRMSRPRIGSTSRPIWPSWPPRPVSQPTGSPARSRTGTTTSAPDRIPTSAVAQAHTTATGATNARRRRPARHSARSTPRRTTRFRCPSVRWEPRVDRAPTETAGSCMSAGTPIPGLFAAGNAMGGVTGRAYGGAGGTIGPAMVFGFRAGYAAATGKPVD